MPKSQQAEIFGSLCQVRNSPLSVYAISAIVTIVKIHIYMQIDKLQGAPDIVPKQVTKCWGTENIDWINNSKSNLIPIYIYIHIYEQIFHNILWWTVIGSNACVQIILVSIFHLITF